MNKSDHTFTSEANEATEEGYANDIDIHSCNENNLEQNVNILYQVFQQIGLKIKLFKQKLSPRTEMKTMLYRSLMTNLI